MESIRLFDAATQRSRERVQSLALGVATELSPDREQAAALLQTLDFSACDEAVAAAVREELATLAAGGTLAGPSFLPALLSPYSLLDHLPGEATVLLDDPTDLARALDEFVAETATMRIEREARGLLPAGCRGSRPRRQAPCDCPSCRRRPSAGASACSPET